MQSVFNILVLVLFSIIGYGQINSPAPVVNVLRDDHVATIEMDFNASAGFGGQLWNIGTDGTEAIGYLVEWWPDASIVNEIVFERGCYTDNHAGTTTVATSLSPHKVISANPVCQIQPIANNKLYHLRVTKVNGLGQFCSPPYTTTFMGGDATRVDALRSEMTFFDDFNLPMGLPDELKWNNAMTPQTDDRFNLFFINPQCHTHTLTGTKRPHETAGDKAQVAQRARKPMLIEHGVRRKIVFDMDGVYTPRGVWYLDFNPVNTDLTGHMSFFDPDGETGLPADVCRIKIKGDDLFVHLINSAGALFNVATAKFSSIGKRMSVNVQRSFDIRLGTDGITVYVDNVQLLDAAFDPGSFKPGEYHALWSTIGYNTSKDDNPYFLNHWDNFGFDGPDVDPYHIHNYVTRLIGTDLQVASSNNSPVFNVQVPDDIRPTVSGVKNEVWLVFSYLKNDYSTFNLEPGDHLLFNGVEYPLPPAGNNSTPHVSGLVTYAGSTISNRIKIGEVGMNEVSPLIQGNNTIQFFADYTGIVNLHVEVKCPTSAPPPTYTPPKDIHPFNLHGDLPKLGPPARIERINNTTVHDGNDPDKTGPTISGEVPVEILAGNDNWSSSWAPHLLQMPAYSAEYWSAGSTKGIVDVSLYIRPRGSDDNLSFRIGQLSTDQDVPAPQIRYAFDFDSRQFANGDYELFVLANNPQGLKSHPGYNGTGFKFDATEFSGGYTPVFITIDNGAAIPSYTFHGTVDSNWFNAANWSSNNVPPIGYNGLITISADCIAPAQKHYLIGDNGTLNVQSNISLTLATEE